MPRTLLLVAALLVGCTPAPYGPENRWFHADARDVPEDLEGTGIRLGDTLAEFVLVDQYGDDVALYQFYGQVVQIMLFAQWCGPCRQEAPGVAVAARDLLEDGVQVVGVMLESNDGTPTVTDLAAWSDAYEIDHPVLADPDGTLRAMLQGGFPTLPILGRDMAVVNVDSWPFSAQRLAQVAADQPL